MKYKRFFAFGCSFTEYHWPTWANVMAYDLQIPSYNWGFCGMGNVGIAHRMVEADLKHQFNESDLLITVWTEWCREDRYYGSWYAPGGVAGDIAYGETWVKKYWHDENDIIKNATAIITSNKMYNIAFNGTILPPNKNNKIYNQYATYQLYSKCLPPMVSFPTPAGPETQWKCTKTVVDGHPDIIEHLHFVRDYIYPRLGLTLRQETVDYYENMYNTVAEKLSAATLSTYEDTREFFKSILPQPAKLGF